MVDEAVDILIVGGGPIGATLLLALSSLPLRILLVEAQPLATKIQADLDTRTLALAPASVRILQTLGLWSSLEKKATPICTIHASEQHRFCKTRLHAKEEPLGYVIALQDLQHALYEAIPATSRLMDARLTHLNKNTHTVTIEHAFSSITITPTLLVAADGMHSAVRHQTGMPISITPFHQQALIANVRLARKHHNVAYERFTTYGPLALLPLQEKQVSLVWGLPPLQAQEYQAMPEKRFLALLQETFGYQLGAFVQVGKRSTFPLMQAIMPKCAAFPYVFIGNAAHTLHPVAGQGFNLGLRDVACLAECIIQQGLHANMLQNYLAMRRYDQASIRIFTQTLLQLFTQSLPGSRVVRGLGMLALDTFPGLQQEFMRHTRGFAGVLPKLVCNIPL